MPVVNRQKVTPFVAGNKQVDVKQPVSTMIDQTTPGTTNGVVINSIPLPPGASTSAKQDTIIAALAIPSNSYRNIVSNTTTTVKSGAGLLLSIVCNNPGTAEVLTVYDSITGSGTKIATISFSGVSALLYNLNFTTGLTVVSSGTTTGDWTIVYR